jgi:hypothetical protein
MKTYGGSGCIKPCFLDLELVGGEWSVSLSGRFTPGERDPGINWIGCWVNSRAGLNDVEKRKFLTLTVLEPRLLGRLARRIYNRHCKNLKLGHITSFRIPSSSLFGVLSADTMYSELLTPSLKQPQKIKDTCVHLRCFSDS